MQNYYGVTSTDEIQIEKAGLPTGTHKVLVVGEEPEKEGRGVVIEYEIVAGVHKGAKGKQWLLTLHSNAQTAAIAKQNLKRLADASGKPIDSMNPIKGRVLTIEVRQQKKNPEYSEISKYLPEDYQADSEIPA